ncbi:MFS transporter [Acrocarpospora macrocephala]|uniref:MFS transporter n=1 Tax=Acrocarpospora macrocephala TaxID=150177 RepID=UPI0012D32109|nr:MFS transporter [Acrocarpospora macrocephala]
MTSNTVRDPRRWWILLVLCLTVLVLVVDSTVLNLAIPALMRDLGATPADIQWILDSYVLVFAGLVLTVGSLSDRYGRRRALIIGLIVFGLASGLATLATEPWQLIAARALMGVGGSVLMPSTLSILITVFDEDERRKAIAAWSSVAMIGVIAGPTLGGVLLQHYYWGSVFLMNVPIAIVAVIAAVTLMPETYGSSRGLDPVGVVLSIIGMSSLVWAVITFPADGWNLGLVAAAVLGLGGFVLWERRTEHPMLPLGLFKDRAFSGACAAIVLLAFGSGALMLALTQYLQFVLGYEPLQAGIALLPYVVAAMVFNGVGAGLGKKVSNRTLIALGLAVIAGAFGLLSTLDSSDGYLLLVVSLIVMGVGGGLAGPAAYTALMGAVPPEHAGVGSALNDTVQQVGIALSIAILGSVLSGAYTASMPESAPAAARASVNVALDSGDPVLVDAGKEAFLSAMSVGSLVGFGFAIAAAIVALAVLPQQRVTEVSPIPTH